MIEMTGKGVSSFENNVHIGPSGHDEEIKLQNYRRKWVSYSVNTRKEKLYVLW